MSHAVQPNALATHDTPPSDRPGRLFFNSFSCERSPAGKCTALVVLEYGGKRWTGKAEGQSSPIGDLRLGAEAAMIALEDFTGGSLGLELMGVKLIRAFDANVVIVSATQRSSREAKLVGCCLADEDAMRGAALAVLNATNRVLGNYLTTR
jgi:hypothetical protein